MSVKGEKQVKKPLKAYKAMTIRGDGKYECRGFIYEVGKTYKHDGALIPCQSGFHCCPKGADVYNYYQFGDNTEVMEISIPASAEIVKKGDKWCVSAFKIVAPTEDKAFNTGGENFGYSNTGDSNTGDRNTGHRNTGDSNTGDSNTGHRNTGDSNTGHRNTGNWNTGNWNTGDSNTGYSNTGDRNTGHRNTGYSNTGDRNTGNWNTGDSNTGHRNTGDSNTGYSNTGDSNTGDSNTGDSNTGDRNTGNWNTGNWNTCNFQTGFFNTVEQPVSLFNGKVVMLRSEFKEHPGYQALLSVPLKITKWTNNAELPEGQKVGEYTVGKTTATGWLEAHKEWWSNMTAANKKLVQTLPGFCPDVFKEITGIDVRSKK